MTENNDDDAFLPFLRDFIVRMIHEGNIPVAFSRGVIFSTGITGKIPPVDQDVLFQLLVDHPEDAESIVTNVTNKTRLAAATLKWANKEREEYKLDIVYAEVIAKIEVCGFDEEREKLLVQASEEEMQRNIVAFDEKVNQAEAQQVRIIEEVAARARARAPAPAPAPDQIHQSSYNGCFSWICSVTRAFQRRFTRGE